MEPSAAAPLSPAATYALMMVGVARQYCGQLGKQDNCQATVSVSLATEEASIPAAYRLYLPETWANDEERRKQAGALFGRGGSGMMPGGQSVVEDFDDSGHVALFDN
jgi:hypothetical protein